MEEPRARGVSLLLVPEGGVHRGLTALIERLAEQLGTASFAPHVTLLPGIPEPEAHVLGRARTLAAEIEPLTVELSGIGGHDTHFRCLFFRALDSRALGEAHARVTRGFGRESDPSFDPHLSLVYGTLPPEVKAELESALLPETPPPFEVRHLRVWRTEGPVGEWRELAAFPLGSGGHP
jgi:2'-5' RNA ligase